MTKLCISVWMYVRDSCLCVSVWRREEAEAAEQTRDTESKTRTPHKDVGNKTHYHLQADGQSAKNN